MKKILIEKGPLTVGDLQMVVNKRSHHGGTISQISNVVAMMPEFVQVGEVQVECQATWTKNGYPCRYAVPIWGVKELEA